MKTEILYEKNAFCCFLLFLILSSIGLLGTYLYYLSFIITIQLVEVGRESTWKPEIHTQLVSVRRIVESVLYDDSMATATIKPESSREKSSFVGSARVLDSLFFLLFVCFFLAFPISHLSSYILLFHITYSYYTLSVIIVVVSFYARN
jgi:hypothetical protein